MTKLYNYNYEMRATIRFPGMEPPLKKKQARTQRRCQCQKNSFSLEKSYCGQYIQPSLIFVIKAVCLTLWIYSLGLYHKTFYGCNKL